MTLTLPKGTSTSELLSPNYPDSFPDNDAMEWYFLVPGKHKAAVQILNLKQPNCLKKETAVEYQSKGRRPSVLRLADRHPEQNQGDFGLTLRNCEMDRRRAGSPGLSLQLKVSSSPGLCITFHFIHLLCTLPSEGGILEISNIYEISGQTDL